MTVIVDYNEVGGPARAGCDPGGAGQSASQVFPDAGFSLEYHPRQPGYVCKVTGLPDDRPCLENDSFWSLWWSDGKSGEWRFSNQGVGGLTVPDGGYVAFAWHEGGGNAQPPDFAPDAPRGAGDALRPAVRRQRRERRQQQRREQRRQQQRRERRRQGRRRQRVDHGRAQRVRHCDRHLERDGIRIGIPERGKNRDREAREPESSDPTSDRVDSTVPGAAEITAGPPSSDLATDTSDDGGGALTTWIGLGLAVLVLGAAGLVTVLRRRSG